MTRVRSMTGYGRHSHPAAGQDHDGYTFTWEVKSVNGRHLDVKYRLPFFLRSRETSWDKIIRSHAGRGRVDVFLNVRILDPDLMGVSLNRSQAEAMLRELSGFAGDRGDLFAPDYNRLLHVSHLWDDDEREPDPGLLESLDRGLEAALADWNESRAVEGAALIQDLSARIETLRGLVDQVSLKAPQVKLEKEETMRNRIQEHIASMGVELDENRILQEVAVLGDKLDVSEELTRLAAHLDRLAQILEAGGETGKRLDFTLQECFREINTCGNKIQDPDASRLCVDMKTELEKCREQVQNLE